MYKSKLGKNTLNVGRIGLVLISVLTAAVFYAILFI